MGWLLVAVAAFGVPLVGVIGFAASYPTFKRFAVDNGLPRTTGLRIWLR
ncbi:hypothetical protein [Streptomyces sp. NPDC049970]